VYEPRKTTSRSINPLDVAMRRVSKLNAVLEVAKAMAAEQSLETLFTLILREAARVAEADRCSLFLVDRERDELWSRVAQGAQSEIRMPIGQGLAGAVALSGDIINLTDAYGDARFNREFDAKNGYRTRSVVTVPMRNNKGEVVGVIQALNSLEGEFTGEDEELLLALGGQAAQAFENVRLHEDINRLFEGFVQASVMAIESRDPTTAGHSGRVANLTVSLAHATEMNTSGVYKHLKFSADQLQEIRYASLLHDFGKIGVREAVLVKAEKLYPHELELLKARFELARKDLKASSVRRLLDIVKQHGTNRLTELEQEEQLRVQREVAQLEDAFAFVLRSNTPNLLSQGNFERLSSLQEMSFEDGHGVRRALLTTHEVESLSIARGSLSAAERHEIESHVTHTFRFLSQIPWTRGLRKVPDIAHAHHEKLDSKGYPQALVAAAIPVQSKMMAIADIYDALTASDRPYKRAVPHQHALDILSAEAKSGKLDTELLRIFVEAEVPRRALTPER
jgi:HD-GYP domain-containing protein (c-di-GMP phosphodiesterase class II)